jgi:hypothetical protein
MIPRALSLLALSMIAAGPPSAGEGALPDSRLGIRTVPLLLLSRADVRADLRLDETQTADALAAIGQMYAKASRLKGMKGDAAVEARRAIDSEQERWLLSHLSDGQRSRLVQIDLQWEGPSALVTRPTVADILALSPEQRAALTQAVIDCIRKRQQGTFQQADERALTRKALETLSKDQRERWMELLGRPFVPQLAATASNRRQ